MSKTAGWSAGMAWHAVPAESVLEELDSSPRGLSVADAQGRLLRTMGPNRLPEPPRRGRFRRFLLQFHNVLIRLSLGRVRPSPAT